MIYHCDISICYHIGIFSLRLASMFYLTRRITLRTFQFLAEIDHIRLNYIKMNWKIPHFRGFFSWFCGLCLLFTLTLSICLFCLPLHSWFFSVKFGTAGFVCGISGEFFQISSKCFTGFSKDFGWIFGGFSIDFWGSFAPFLKAALNQNWFFFSDFSVEFPIDFCWIQSWRIITGFANYFLEKSHKLDAIFQSIPIHFPFIANYFISWINIDQMKEDVAEISQIDIIAD